MRRLTLLLLLVVALVISACQPQAEAAPTEEPTTEVEPTAEAEAAEDAEAPEVTEEAETEEAETEEAEAGDENRLILATTTSTENSGLLAEIVPMFEEETGIDIDIVAVGTGQALELGRNGDADVVLVHARALEDAFVEEGYGTQRYDVMYNDFVILGPEEDPANVAEAESAADAFARIAAAEAQFISRGDDSGTHVKEQEIWAAADVTPEGDWYESAGQGMGAVLTIANEQLAYTLSDRGTYIPRTVEGTDLVVLYEGDEILFNPYGVIPVNPELHPTVNADAAQQFVDWLISVETQEAIANFQLNDQQLFFPDSEPYREAQAE